MQFKAHPFSTIILAAGISKRMYSRTSKVLYKILGKPMINFVVELASELNSKEIIIVAGKNLNELKETCGKGIKYTIQDIPRGSGDAAKKGLALVTNPYTLILYGDVPLLQKKTILAMIDNHFKQRAVLSILTCDISDPAGYGRIVRDNRNKIKGIVEHIDATKDELKINEINTGIYFGTTELITKELSHINNKNKQKEFYLTDIVHNLIKNKKKVIAFKINDEEEIMGINTKLDLVRVRDVVKRRWLNELMLRGVYIEDPLTTTIDLTVQIGKFVHIRPFSIIEGNTIIKDDSIVGPFVWIKDGKKKVFKI